MPAFGTEERQRIEIAMRKRHLYVLTRRITQRRSNVPTKAEMDTINQLKQEIETLKRGEPI